MQEPSSTSATIPLLICPTTHNDWDWLLKFEEYYSSSNAPNNIGGVQAILNNVAEIFAGSSDEDKKFRFSYAEIGFLRQYLQDHPEKIATFREAGRRFCLLGGGITSPDNQVSHCEVFIRNYLTGHEYLKSVGLIDKVFFVAWLPDDFGHDPQLPVLIEALGMKALAVSRIPGSIQPQPCSATQHAARDVRTNGMAFNWPGADGSGMLTHFMPATYYGITNYSVSDAGTGMTDFLENNYLHISSDDRKPVVWPGDIVFATQGGDWQYPATPELPPNSDYSYDWTGAIDATVSTGGVVARSELATFADYYDRLMRNGSTIPSFELYAENYWTGYFASRPQLKIDHYNAAQWLLGAEVLGALLALCGDINGQEAEKKLAEAIAEGWHQLVPTTHHDFVTGTSPDSVYDTSGSVGQGPEMWDANGQLSMSSQAAILAADAVSLGMTQLADLVAANPYPGEIPVVVFNQIGRDLPDTAMVEMDDPSGGTVDYRIRVGEDTAPVQRSSNNTLLFQVPGMRSMAYRVVYLIPGGAGTPPMASQPKTGEYIFTNDGVVSLLLSQSDGWAIKQLTIDRQPHIQVGGPYANRIGIWSDSGNIYQFGMEYQSYCNQYGGFAFTAFLNGTTGALVEKGPIRWRFIATLVDPASGATFTTQYDLIRGEKLVRITTSGAAPDTGNGTSVLVSFPMQTNNAATGSMLEYGTSAFWENRNPQQSWDGLTFRASHDFAQLLTGDGNAIAAVYHNGIPAWTIDGAILRGCLLRNTPGGGRGASGHDNSSHTQHYTLDVEARPAETGYPLRTALYTQTPLRARVVTAAAGAGMPEQAHLASVDQADAVLRVAKMTHASEDAGRSLILRVQQARRSAQQLDIQLPFLAGGGTRVAPEIVTALETSPANPPEVELSGTTASFQANRALWTMRVPITLQVTRVE